MKLKYIIGVLLFIQTNIFSQENHHSEIFLEIPNSYNTIEYSDDLKNWRILLYKKHNINDSLINEEIFLKTDIKLNVNGLIRTNEVYQSLSNKNRFYIKVSQTLIDFNQKLIGTMGVNGISTIKPKTKPIVIVIAPKKDINLLGITLDFTVKTQVPTPVFNKNSVSFNW